MRETERRLAMQNGTLDEEYAASVHKKIRKKYSLSDELSLLRRRDEAKEAFAAYHAYAESCKAEARAQIYGSEEVTA